MSNTEYREHRTHVPPVLALENGELVIKLMFGDQTYVAGVGDGRHFFSQVVDKLVDPALHAAYRTPNDGVGGLHAGPDERRILMTDEPVVGDGQAFRAFVGPND